MQMTRKYYYSLCLEAKYQIQAQDEAKKVVFITSLNHSVSVLILQGLERLLLANLSAASEHSGAFIESISYYQDNEIHRKRE